MPNDRPEDIQSLKDENERLRSSLRRIRRMLDDYRSKVVANANGDYRPPYDVDDQAIDKRG